MGNATDFFDPEIYIDAYKNNDVCRDDKLMENIVWWSLCFVYIGVFNFIAYPTFSYMFGKAGEELTSRLRYKSFKVGPSTFALEDGPSTFDLWGYHIGLYHLVIG